MIALFSGFWPYFKLACMMYAWMVPVAILNVEKRENLLMWLDALGKYSLVDAYVLVLMMVAFRFHIASPSNGMIVDVLVNPQWGFYGFLLATMTSLAMGHIVLAFNRHATAKGSMPENGEKMVLMNYKFNFDGKQVKMKSSTKIVTISLLLLAIVLLGIGAVTDSFNFVFEGAAGLVLGDKSEASYSLVSLGEQIPLSVDNPDRFEIRWIEIVYFLFALGMPFACLVVMLFLFTSNLTLRSANRLYVLAEVANAWSALEVFVISIIAALTEISQFASFIIGDKCDGINKILEEFLDKPLEGNDICFDVKATLGKESAYLFSAALLTTFLSWNLLKMAHVVLEERMDKHLKIHASADHKHNFVHKWYKRAGFLFSAYDAADGKSDEGSFNYNPLSDDGEDIKVNGLVGRDSDDEGGDEDGGGGIYASTAPVNFGGPKRGISNSGMKNNGLAD